MSRDRRRAANDDGEFRMLEVEAAAQRGRQEDTPMFWPDDWRGTLALVLAGGAMIALIILSSGLVLVAATGHDVTLVSVALACVLVGLGLGGFITWLVMRDANDGHDLDSAVDL
jgi:hypothetical protein